MWAIQSTGPTAVACKHPVDVLRTDREIHRVYRGLKPPSRRERRHLEYMIHCADMPLAIPTLRKILRMAREAQQKRIRDLRSWASAPITTASYYDDSGQTASGTHYTLGFASLMYGSEWGLRITFCRYSSTGCGGPKVTGELDDHGPYVGGRGFDLDEALRSALDCSDLCTVRWKIR